MAFSGNELTRQLHDILPGDWMVRVYRTEGKLFDGWLELTPPSGPTYRFELEYKPRFEPRDVDEIERLRRMMPAHANVLLVAPYLSPRSRTLLAQRGISHADLTGNLRLSSESLFIDRAGAQKNPKRATEERTRTSLRGPVTGRVVRFLCDSLPPLKVREIAMGTNVNAGNVSRILEFLDRERFVKRGARGLVEAVDWESLIRRWSQDVKKDRRSEIFLEPRGIELVTRRLSGCRLPYAITGSFAAAQLAPVVAPVSIDLYVRDIDEGREALSLHASDRVGNVRLIQAFDRVALERTLDRNHVLLAAPPQIAADILTLPRRSSDEFMALIDWMKRNERIWRTGR